MTVVWGRPYVELFLDVAVPNQMTRGNLGALPSGSRYRVFTSPEDADVLAASAALARIREQMPVDLVVMPELSNPSTAPLARTTAGHSLALADARDVQAGVVFLNADFFLSEGALAAMMRRHAAGSRAVVTHGMRLNKDTVVASLRARGGVRSIESRELVSLALDHLHPFTRAHMIDAAQTAHSPISVYWNVPGEGILARALYLQPLMVDPVFRDVLPKPNDTIDAFYLVSACPQPEQIHIAADSDELCFFELSHVDDAAPAVERGGISIWRAAAAQSRVPRLRRSDIHPRYYWAQQIRLHVRDINDAWSLPEKESALFSERVWRVHIVVTWLRMTFSEKGFRRHAGNLRKWLRHAARPVSWQRTKRSLVLVARRVPKERDRAVRTSRRMLRRCLRAIAIMRHSIVRDINKLRKRTTRAWRRVLAR